MKKSLILKLNTSLEQLLQVNFPELFKWTVFSNTSPSFPSSLLMINKKPKSIKVYTKQHPSEEILPEQRMQPANTRQPLKHTQRSHTETYVSKCKQTMSVKSCATHQNLLTQIKGRNRYFQISIHHKAITPCLLHQAFNQTCRIPLKDEAKKMGIKIHNSVKHWKTGTETQILVLCKSIRTPPALC